MQQETSGCLPLLRRAFEVGHCENIFREEIRIENCWKGFVLVMCVVGKKKLVIEAVIYGWRVHSLRAEKNNEKRCLDGKK